MTNKTKTISFRISEEEYATLNLIAARAGKRRSISAVARDLMFMGIDSLDSEEDIVAAGTPAVDPEQLEAINEQLTTIRQQINAQTYVMLYHLLPVHEDMKGEASRSASERFEKYKRLIGKIDDAPAVEKQRTTELA